MPSVSKDQQTASAMALASKRGDIPKSKLRGASKQMASSMNEQQLKEFAETKRKGLPTKVAFETPLIIKEALSSNLLGRAASKAYKSALGRIPSRKAIKSALHIRGKVPTLGVAKKMSQAAKFETGYNKSLLREFGGLSKKLDAAGRTFKKMLKDLDKM